MGKEIFISRYAITEKEVLKRIKENCNAYDVTLITRQPKENDPDILLSAITILTETQSDEDPDILV